MKFLLRLFLLVATMMPLLANASASSAPGKQPNSHTNARVVYVSDGDTVVVMPDSGIQIKCRLYGIDAPETLHEGRPGQPFAAEAGNALRVLLLGKMVEVTYLGERSYDREICVIKHGGKDIGLQMVEDGYAWAYRKYLKKPDKEKYIAAEKSAKSSGKGLWADGDAMNPAKFKAINW